MADDVAATHRSPVWGRATDALAGLIGTVDPDGCVGVNDLASRLVGHGALVPQVLAPGTPEPVGRWVAVWFGAANGAPTVTDSSNEFMTWRWLCHLLDGRSAYVIERMPS